MPWDLYTPFAKMVLEAGYDFAVAEDGRVSIQEVERAEHSFDAVEILRRAQAIEWKDEELLDALSWGTTDHSEPTPRVCILARATKGAMVHADVFERKVVEETGKGFVVRRAWGQTGPTTCATSRTTSRSKWYRNSENGRMALSGRA